MHGVSCIMMKNLQDFVEVIMKCYMVLLYFKFVGILLDDIITRLMAFRDKKLDSRLKLYVYSAVRFTKCLFVNW